MEAIVLSCDRYQPLADHMIERYRAVWPSHPFRFRVPYQVYPDAFKDKHRDAVHLVEAPSGIKGTVLALIDGLANNEWVYWCIDDKYPLALDNIAANDCYNWIKYHSDRTTEGLLFCRCRDLLDEENLRDAGPVITPTGQVLRERRNYYQFWIHQFMRVGVLRRLFTSFPDRPFRAKEMDVFTGQVTECQVKAFASSEKMYVTQANYARFGESTIGGKLTRNCRESMKAHGFRQPADFEVRSNVILIGDYPLPSPQ